MPAKTEPDEAQRAIGEEVRDLVWRQQLDGAIVFTFRGGQMTAVTSVSAAMPALQPEFDRVGDAIIKDFESGRWKK